MAAPFAHFLPYNLKIHSIVAKRLIYHSRLAEAQRQWRRQGSFAEFKLILLPPFSSILNKKPRSLSTLCSRRRTLSNVVVSAKILRYQVGINNRKASREEYVGAR